MSLWYISWDLRTTPRSDEEFPMSARRFVLSLVLVFGFVLQALAQGLPAAVPETVGMSAPRLERLKAVMQDYVDKGRIAGIVTVVTRGGKLVHFETYGKMDVEKNVPMRKDVVLRMASMTKAVTTVAVAILLEEGKILLTDPVSKYLPAFKNTTVVTPPPPGAANAGRYGVVPAKRQITIRDLLTHTAGISYGQGNPAEAKYKEAGILG
jgi:CubicO group peptidase (beta-lactamase class C family)